MEKNEMSTGRTAPNLRSWVSAVVGMIVGVGLAVLVFSLIERADSAEARPDQPVDRSSVEPAEDGSAALHSAPNKECACAGQQDQTAELTRKNQELRREVSKLKERLETEQADVLSKALGMKIMSRDTFAAEKRDDDWATETEGELKVKLKDHFGERLGKIPVECREKCCQIAVDEFQFRKMEPGFVSSGGLGLGGPGVMLMTEGPGPSGDPYFMLCFNRDKTDLEKPADRDAERQAVLDAAHAGLEKCKAGLKKPLLVDMKFLVNPAGDIKTVNSQAEPLGHPAASCVERALLTAANFGPAQQSMDLWVPFVIQLEPEK